MKCGFVGLGNIGLPVVLNLLQNSQNVMVFDLKPEREQLARDAGAEKSPGLRDIFQTCDIVFASLPNPQACEAVTLGRNGLAEMGKPGQIFIEMSTVSPRYLKKLQDRVRPRNIEIIDCGVAKGTTYKGESLTYLIAGGRKEIFDSITYLLDFISDKFVYVGPLGSGMIVKLINNLMSLVNLVTSCEGIALGFKAGVPAARMIDILSENSGDSYQLRTRGKRLLERGDFQWGGLSLELAIKDCELIRELGKDAGIPLYMLNMANLLYEHAKNKGYGDKDRAAVITVFEDIIGQQISLEA